jgi:outer membrane protein
MIKKLILGLSFPALLFCESLNDLIEMSLKNKNVISSEKSVESIQEAYESAKKGYLPIVSVGGGYTDVSYKSGEQDNNSLNAYADVTYNIYDGGKKNLTYKSYESQIKTSKEDLISLKNEVSLEVIEHYFNYLTYVSQKDAKLKEIEQLNAQNERLSKFLDAGTVTIDEIDKIVSNIESANLELQELELDIQTILHELEYIIGKKVSINEGSYIEIASDEAEQRNDIKSLEHSMQTALISAKTTKTTNNPQVSISNTYKHYNYNYENSAYEDLALEDQNVLAVNLTWNIFDFGSTQSAYSSAYKSFLSAKSKYEYEKNKADVDLRLAEKSYDIAKIKIKSAKAGLNAAISTYNVIKNKFENGLVDNVSYLEALSDMSDAISSLSATKYELEIKKANLVYQKGKNVWEYVK